MAERKWLWTKTELRVLHRLARAGYPSTVIALRIGRSLTAVQKKAAAKRISFGAGRSGERASECRKALDRPQAP